RGGPRAALESRLQMEGGGEALTPPPPHLVKQFRRIPARHPVERRAGELGLEVQNRRGMAFGARRAGRLARLLEWRDELVHLHQVFRVVLPNLLRAPIVAKLIIAIREAESGLVDARNDHGGIGHIGSRSKFEERVYALGMEAGEELRKTVNVSRSAVERAVDRLQFRFERSPALALDAWL